ncbi:MAG: FtsK/SpoIIIE domain-containing protein, partial [Acidimicrobiales bacterium]
MQAKLGLSDVSVGWKREGIHRYVQFRRQEPVPDKVPFRNPDVRELIEAESTPSRVLLGFTRGGVPVWLDLDRQAPHVLMSAGTGGGKTAALVAIIAQLMWHGAEVVVLDFKRLSHLWLRDLAGVRYARDIDEIHRTAMWLGEEVDRRTKAWDPVTFDQREAGLGPKFPRLVIVCEEMSSTMDYLREHWTDVRQSGDPQRSPAVTALAKVLNMGREVQMNTLTVAQRAEANAVGNGAMRENYPVKILIDRYSKQTWNILAPECDYVPGVAHPGRAQVCIGATATETQMRWITQREAQRWVIDTRGMQPRQRPAAVRMDAVDLGKQGAAAAVARQREPSLPGGIEPVSLWEASQDKGRGIVAMTYSALRSERLRHPGEFPEAISTRGDTPLHDPRDLQRWENNRVRSKQGVGTTSPPVDRGNETDGVG